MSSHGLTDHFFVVNGIIFHCLDVSLLIHSFTEGHLAFGNQDLAILNKAAIGIGVQVFLWA